MSHLKCCRPFTVLLITQFIRWSPRMAPPSKTPWRHWAEHLSELLNCVTSTDPTLVYLIPQFPVIPQFDDPPALHEIQIAIKKWSSPLPAAALIIHRAWSTGKLPQQWKEAKIVTVFERKGDRQICGNSSGISSLSVAGRIFARVMRRLLLTHIVHIVMPETECGFRRDRRSIDIIFVARLPQEKCREQNHDLFLAFNDLTKAFDTVNRDLLWKVLSKFGCRPTFLLILQEFHNSM